MDAIFALLSSGPVTILVVAVLLVVLHKAGVLETILAFISKKPNIASPDTVAAVREALQPLMGEMEGLKQYANHETTNHLKEHTRLLTEICENVKELKLTHDNYEKIGVKTRDCSTH